MALAQDQATGRGICAAFSRDSIAGSVYVEAFSLDDVKSTMHGINGVLHYQQSIRVDLIPLIERAALLDMTSVSTIRRNSWVRVTRRGRYKNDLALVRSIENDALSAVVLLVPRIRLTRKRGRKGRVEPALFDVVEAKSTFGEESVVREGDVCCFHGNKFVQGLVQLSFEIHELCDRSVNALQHELDLFRQSRIDSVVEATNSGIVKLRVSDKIRVVAGPYQGSSGRLTAIGNDHSVTFECANLSGPQRVQAWEVRKRFGLGDFVQAVCGEHEGEEGFIIVMEDDYVEIYTRAVKTHRETLHYLNHEVRFHLCNITSNDPFHLCTVESGITTH
jgi:ribosomal protein L24